NNPAIKSDPTGTDEINIFHKTNEKGAVSMTREGAKTNMSTARVWAGSGFYGLDKPEITGSGAKGDVIVSQTIKTDKIADLDKLSGRPGTIGARITNALQETDLGKKTRSEIWRQMYDLGESQAKSLGRKPSDQAIDNYFRDYMDRQIKKIAPDAEVIR